MDVLKYKVFPHLSNWKQNAENPSSYRSGNTSYFYSHKTSFLIYYNIILWLFRLYSHKFEILFLDYHDFILVTLGLLLEYKENYFCWNRTWDKTL